MGGIGEWEQERGEQALGEKVWSCNKQRTARLSCSGDEEWVRARGWREGGREGGRARESESEAE